MLQTPSPSMLFEAAFSPCRFLHNGAKKSWHMVSLYFSKSPVFNFLKILLHQDLNLPNETEVIASYCDVYLWIYKCAQ